MYIMPDLSQRTVSRALRLATSVLLVAGLTGGRGAEAGEESWGPEADGFRCSVSLEKRTGCYHAGEPIQVTLATKCVGIGQGFLDDANPLLIYDITVLGPDGKRLRFSHGGNRLFERACVWADGRELHLIPGAQTRSSVRLDHLFDLSVPGEYQVSATRRVELPGFGGIGLRSNKMTFRVVDEGSRCAASEPVEAPKPRPRKPDPSTIRMIRSRLYGGDGTP
jgi:hypothetical protein